MKHSGAADSETVADSHGNLNEATRQECCSTEVMTDKDYDKADTLACFS